MGAGESTPPEPPGGSQDPFVAIVRDVTEAVVDFGGRLTALEKSVDADRQIIHEIHREAKARREAEERRADAEEKSLELARTRQEAELAQSNKRWDRVVEIAKACFQNPLIVAPSAAALTLLLQILAAWLGVEMPEIPTGDDP